MKSGQKGSGKAGIAVAEGRREAKRHLLGRKNQAWPTWQVKTRTCRQALLWTTVSLSTWKEHIDFMRTTGVVRAGDLHADFTWKQGAGIRGAILDTLTTQDPLEGGFQHNLRGEGAPKLHPAIARCAHEPIGATGIHLSHL